MSINRELSQLASFIDVQESNNFIGISTGGTYTVGIGTSSVTISSNGTITAPLFLGATGSSLIDHIDLQDEGNLVGTGFTTLNFVGAAVTITQGVTGVATITVDSAVVGGEDGAVQFASGGTLTGISTLLFADSTNHRVGIGSSSPTSKLDVGGTVNVSGVSTFQDNVFLGDNDKLTFGDSGDELQIYHTGSLSYISDQGPGALRIIGNQIRIRNVADNEELATFTQNGSVELYYDNSKKFETTVNGIAVSGIVTAISGVVTYYGDGTNLTLTDSVALGGDTTGDYVASISGTANQIAVDVTSGEGTTPVISIPNNPTLPGTTVTIQNDLQVNRDLNVNGNITIGGTSATLFTQTLSVADADLILGVRTDANGNDVSTDTTASHGGIAIASTEGTPLVTLVNPGAGETLPATYKKIMWFEQGAFAGLGTDAWLINYGVGIGSTQVPNNVFLAAGDVHITNNDIKKVRDINATGIITASTFVSNVSTGTSPLTVTSTTLVSNLNADKLDGQEGTYYLNYANFSGIATDSDKLDGQQGTYYLSYNNFVGLATDSDKLDGQQGTYYLDYTNFVGLATDSDKLDGQQGSYYLDYANFSGIATDSDKLDGQEGTYYLDYSNFVGVATDSSLLDGIDSTSFLRSDAADTKTSGDLSFDDNVKAKFGSGTDNLSIYHNGANSIISNNGSDSGSIYIQVTKDNERVHIQSDNGSGGLADYFAAYGNSGEAILYHFGNQKLATKSNGIDVTGHTETDTLNVSGIATAQDFNSASDENLKTNIRTIEDPLAKVVQIRGVNFDWKETQRPALGVIAQEVEKVLPELVTDNGTKTVNYNGLIGLLIEAVKAQQEEIDILKSKIK